MPCAIDFTNFVMPLFLGSRFKMFHRAKKIPVTQKDKDEKIPLYKLERVRRMRRTEEEKAEKESEKESEKDSERESEKESERSERSEEEKNDEEKEEGKKDKGEKKKRKIRLDMHLEQVKICPVILLSNSFPPDFCRLK